MKLHQFFVYIMTNDRNKILYIGVTRDLAKRTCQHKDGSYKGFTEQYNLRNLVYFEIFDTAEAAIAREKQLKNWHRQWKIDLIKQANPQMRDLSGMF